MKWMKMYLVFEKRFPQSFDLLCSVRREQRPTESRPIGGHDVTLSEGTGMWSSSHAPGHLWSGDQAETGWRGGGEDEKRLVVSSSFQIFTLLWWVFILYVDKEEVPDLYLIPESQSECFVGFHPSAPFIINKSQYDEYKILCPPPHSHF